MGRTSGARERLVESANHLIYLNGYQTASVGDICKKADVRTGSFYYYFASKQELTLEVLDRFKEKVVERYRSALEGDAPLAKKLESLFAGSKQGQIDSSKSFGCAPGCLAGNLALELSNHDEAIRRKIEEFFSLLADLYAQALRQAIASGEIEMGDVDHMAESLVTYGQGKALMTKLKDDPSVLDDASFFAKRLVGLRD